MHYLRTTAVAGLGLFLGLSAAARAAEPDWLPSPLKRPLADITIGLSTLGAGVNAYVATYDDTFVAEAKKLGVKLPFKSPSYTLGVYIPRLTRDGLTDGRLEWTLLDRNYSTHSDSLYWTNDGVLMGYPLGPGGQRLDWGLGRWLALRYKLESDLYYEFREPLASADASLTERGAGFRLGLVRLPFKVSRLQGAMADFELAAAAEYVSHINYLNADSTRVMLMVSIGLAPPSGAFTWR